MRSELRKALPAVRVLPLTCESFLEQTTDMRCFSFGQSLHYMSQNEVHRVLEVLPSGGHILVVNNHPVGNNWLGEVSGYWHLMFPRSENPVAGQVKLLSDDLGAPETMAAEHELSLSPERALGFISSLSSFTCLDRCQQEAILAFGRAALVGHCGEDGQISLTFRCEAHLWHR